MRLGQLTTGGASGARLRFGDAAAAITAAAGLRPFGSHRAISRCGAVSPPSSPWSSPACSPPAPGESDGRTGLQHALARVADSPATSVRVEYGDLAAVRGMLGSGKARFERVRDFGSPDLVPVAGRLSAGLGVDPRSFATAIAVGQAPDWAGLLLGEYDSAGAAKRVGDPAVAGDPAGVPALARIGAGGGAFAYASSQEGLAAVERPGERTLAANEVLAPLADCLGEASWRC